MLIEPGLYNEEVLVTKAHRNLHIRGMDRNTVVLDGEHKPNRTGANGILIEHANDVWVENLTVRNFNRANSNGKPTATAAAATRSGGRAGTRSQRRTQENGHGWWGSYLTAYDTGQRRLRHLHPAMKEGSWNNIYASGFNDSGIYIGACWECKAKVSNGTFVDNARRLLRVQLRRPPGDRKIPVRGKLGRHRAERRSPR